MNTWEKVASVNLMRMKMNRIAWSLFPLVLLTGFFTAGTCAGISCNTYPWVGEHWFYNSKHFFSSETSAWWRNFTENKLICQVNHRTFATIMTFWATAAGYNILKLKNLPGGARFSVAFLIAALWMQLAIGVNVIWQSVPVWLASSHQVGAMTVLTALILTLHSARRVDLRHIKNLLGRLKLEDRAAYERFMKHQGKRMNFSGK